MESLFSPAPTSHRSTTPPTPAPTTDFAVIEAQKENIRPAASGRSAATLSTLLDKDAQAEKVVQEGHERFKKEIEDAERKDKEGEDMPEGYLDILDVYNQYVLYNVQHHPSSATHLLPLLESTTRRFTDDVRYQQDVRYLKLWIMFARNTERREEIWSFLESRDIGTKHALFYEEWSTVLEGLNRKRRADEVYKLGIHRRAAPLERLKTRHATFLERVTAIDGQIPVDEASTSSRSTSAPGARNVLGHVATPAGPGGLAGATPQQTAPSTRVSSQSNGSRMAVFSDGDAPAEAAEGGVWSEFGTRDGRRKENVVEATPWKGETMPQSAKRGLAPRTPKMEVFKDTTNDENSNVRPAEGFFHKGGLPASEADLIKLDPLRFYDRTTTEPAPAPTLPPPPSARKPPRPKKAPGFVMSTWTVPSDGPELRDSKGKVKERRMFAWDQVYKHDEEWSFAEIRARQRGLLGKEWRGEVQSWEQEWHPPGSSTPRKEEKKIVKPPSPTVNTKLANDDVARMFDQTIHGGRRASDSDDSSDESSDEDEDEVVVAPTPLPSRTAPPSMMQPVSGMVPPTPTPASSGSGGRLNIFSDENAAPPAAKPSKFQIFGDENANAVAKTPIVSRTPLAAASSSSRPFEIHSDENAAPMETPSIVRQPSARAFMGAPAQATMGPARSIASQVIHEELDERSERPDPVADERSHGAEEDEFDYDDGNRKRPEWMSTFNVMTPITERTCEYTNFTQMSRLSLAASTGPGADKTHSSGQSSAEQVGSGASHGGLSIVREEEDRSRRFSERSASPAEGESERFIDTTSPIRDDANCSGGPAGPDFALPEGFTIHSRPLDENQSMGIVDRMARHSLAPTDAETADEDTDTAAFVTATGGELSAHDILKNPCCPVDDQVTEALLGLIQPPLAELPNFHDCRTIISGKLEELNKFAKSRMRRSQNARASMSTSLEDGLPIELAGKEYEVVEKIGEGGFGAVFLAVDLAKRDELDEKSDVGEDEEDAFLVAIKVETPTALWEAVVLDRIHRRLAPTLAASVIKPQSLVAFSDESFLLLDYSSQGTLLDLVNKAQQLSIAPATSGAPPAVDEILAVFFTIELLRLVEGLHSCGFIHGDLKIDNCLLRLEPLTSAEGGNNAWSAQYQRDGSDGWSKKGVRLIDFGRAIDMSLWPAGQGGKQEFVADWEVDERDCVEIKEGKSWSYQTDYAGLASVVYCLLFGKYIQTEMTGEGSERRVKIATPLRRYWQTDLWNQLFDTLLNSTTVRADGELPITSELSGIRTNFEEWLEGNCQKGGKNLRAMLKKVETALMRR